MPLPDDFYDDDKNYMVRLCMLVEDAELVVVGSKINSCDGCDALIWVAEDQEPPPPPPGMVIDGNLSVCKNCSKEIFAKQDAQNPEFLQSLPPEIQAEARDYFGL